jgi:RNA polymerase sigma factor (sigma-70 family)
MIDGNRHDAEEKHHTALSLEAPALSDDNCTQEQGGEKRGIYFFAGLASLPDDVYRIVTASLARIAERVGVPRAECEDVAQEVWLQAAKDPERFRGEHGLRRLCSWLAKVAHNRARDALRDLKRKSVPSLDALAAEPMDRKAVERIDAAEWSEWLAVILARLRREEPENCRLLSEHHLGKRSIQELADATSWKANEIRCRIYRGMEKLRSWASESRPCGEDVC